MIVLYLDPYVLGDPLFATGLARDLRARMDAGGSGLIIVHGSGEEGERAIEAMGSEPVRERGELQYEEARTAAAVERAGRDLNRRLVDALNEEGVSAFRVVGSDRGLVRPDGSIGRTEWLTAMADQRTVPVVLAGTENEEGHFVDVDPASLASRLGSAISATALAALSSRPLQAGEADFEEAGRLVPDPKALRRMALAGSDLLVVSRSALRQVGVPAGVRVKAGAAGSP